MIDLDPSIIDQDSIRKKRRKKLLLTALAPLIVLVLLSGFCLRPGVFDFIFNMSYNGARDGGTLIPLASMQKFANILEPYIAYYDLGTAFIKDSKFTEAEAELRDSLSNNPPQEKLCQVRVNLSYSIEKQGDEAVNSRQYDKALLLYGRAEGVLYEDNCASKKDDGNGEDQNAEKAVDRISQKRGSAVSKMNGNNQQGDNPDGNDQRGNIEVDEAVIQQLKQSNVNGNELRVQIYSVGQGAGMGGFSLDQHW